MSEKNLQIEYSGLTDIGMVRTENQDSFGKFPSDDLNIYTDKGQLFIVADGMGGHTGGKQASSLAVDTICKIYSESDHFNLADSLHASIVAANSRIHQASGKSTELSRMGTTCTTLLLHEDVGIIGHVGDSRVYRIENGKIEQLTEDHTQVQAMLKEGVLTPEEAKVYPSRSVLARALGVEEKVKVDIIQNIKLRNGQIYLLCSDGLAKVTDNEILKIVSENSTETACKQLVALANERGGKDNVTVQIIKVGTKKSIPLPSPEIESETDKQKIRSTPARTKSKVPIITVIILVVLLLAGYSLRDTISSLFTTGERENDPLLINNDDQLDIDKQDGDTVYKDLLTRADRLFQNGRLETALDLYKEILDEEPMNFSAIQGINRIALEYQKTGDELMSNNNFEGAVKLFHKVLELQPENEKVQTLIKICETQLTYGTQDAPVDAIPVPKQIPRESGIVVTSKFNSGDWNFFNLPSNQYNLDESEIEFSASSSVKKSLFKTDLTNAEISIEIKYNLPDSKSMVGIIIGHNHTGGSGKEEYYLLNCQRSGLTLQKITDKTPEQLIKLNTPPSDDKSGTWKLKVLSVDSRIHVFSEARLLGNWEGSEKISGKVGITAGPDVYAKFINVHIRGMHKSN